MNLRFPFAKKIITFSPEATPIQYGEEFYAHDLAKAHQLLAEAKIPFDENIDALFKSAIHNSYFGNSLRLEYIAKLIVILNHLGTAQAINLINSIASCYKEHQLRYYIKIFSQIKNVDDSKQSSDPLMIAENFKKILALDTSCNSIIEAFEEYLLILSKHRELNQQSLDFVCDAISNNDITNYLRKIIQSFDKAKQQDKQFSINAIIQIYNIYETARKTWLLDEYFPLNHFIIPLVNAVICDYSQLPNSLKLIAYISGYFVFHLNCDYRNRNPQNYPKILLTKHESKIYIKLGHSILQYQQLHNTDLWYNYNDLVKTTFSRICKSSYFAGLYRYQDRTNQTIPQRQLITPGSPLTIFAKSSLAEPRVNSLIFRLAGLSAPQSKKRRRE